MGTHFSTSTIAYSTAARAVALAIDKGADIGVRVVAAVVDPGLTLVAFGKADNATPHSVETSRRKANTAASTRRPSASIPPDLAVALENGTGGLLTSIKGGVPVAFDGSHIGGLGVAGGTPEQDAEIAAAVLQALGADQIGEMA